MEGAAGASRREERVVEGNEEAQKQGSETGHMRAEPTEREADWTRIMKKQAHMKDWRVDRTDKS